MNHGIYHIGKRRIVINSHTTKEEIEGLKKKYPQLDNTKEDDNSIKESSIDNKSVSKSGQIKPRGKRKHSTK